MYEISFMCLIIIIEELNGPEKELDGPAASAL
jgi:hypothetical protein